MTDVSTTCAESMTQMIIFNQGMLLLGSNHFLNNNVINNVIIFNIINDIVRSK